jgi:uroporphyrinogen-III synthase
LPQSECAEGVIDLLAALDLSGSLVLYPHSAIARPLLRNFLNERKIPHFAAALYETVPLWQSPLDLEQFSRIVFTSPSTVEGFLQIYPNLPNSNKIYAIGPVTRRYLERLIVKNGKSC